MNLPLDDLLKVVEPRPFLPQELLLGQKLFSAIPPEKKTPILVFETGKNSKNVAGCAYILLEVISFSAFFLSL